MKTQLMSCLALSATQTATILHLFGCLTSSACLLCHLVAKLYHYLLAGTWFFNPPYSHLSSFISYGIMLGGEKIYCLGGGLGL
jgi:hypothetical protein